jgi:dipeptidyl aminopeptidase/acylaminoacyl peptidase
MRRLLLLASALALDSCSAHAPLAREPAASRAPAAPVPLETYFQTRRLYGVSFSADEKWVAFASDEGGRPDVWVEPIEGGPATQITHVNGQLWTFDFSPTEDRLVYQTDAGGDENTRLYLTDHAGGPGAEITAGDPEGSRAELVGWGRDGKTLLYQSNRRDPKFVDVYEYDFAAKRSKLVWQATGKLSFAVASHDHKALALVETLSDVDSNAYLVEGGKSRLITPHTGNVLYAPTDFSQDGRKLLYTSDEAGEFQSLYEMDLDSGKSHPVLESGWDVEAAGWSPAFHYQFTQVNEDGAPKFDLRDAAGKPVALPAAPRGAFWSLLTIYRYPDQPRFSKSERYFGANIFGGSTPGVPYVIDLVKGTAHPVAEVMPPALRGRPMVAPESVRIPTFDGRKVPAFLYRPANPSGPAVIVVHGGPTAQSLQRSISSPSTCSPRATPSWFPTCAARRATARATRCSTTRISAAVR